MGSRPDRRRAVAALLVGVLGVAGCAGFDRAALLDPAGLVPPAPGVPAAVGAPAGGGAPTGPGAGASGPDAGAPSGGPARGPALGALAGPGPHDLEALVDHALGHDPRTRAAWATARARAARLGREQAAWLPALEAALDASYEVTHIAENPDPLRLKQWSVDPAVRLRWLLLDFGRREQRAAEAREHLLAASLTLDRTLEDVVFDVARAYYALAAADALVVAAEQALARARTVLDAAESRLGVGLATRPDVLLAREAHVRAAYDLESARAGVHDAQAGLALATGLRADRPLPITGLPDTPPDAVGERVEALVDDALTSRPDLLAAAAEVRARDAAVAGSRAAFLPELSVLGAYGQNFWWYRLGGQPQDTVNQPAYGAGLALRWTIFDGLARVNTEREALAEAERARAAEARVRLDVTAQVWRAWHDWRAARRKVDYAAALVANAEEAYAATLASYANGLATMVDLRTAERDLASAAFVQVQTRAELLTRAAEVAWASGAAPRTTPLDAGGS